MRVPDDTMCGRRGVATGGGTGVGNSRDVHGLWCVVCRWWWHVCTHVCGCEWGKGGVGGGLVTHSSQWHAFCSDGEGLVFAFASQCDGIGPATVGCAAGEQSFVV